MSAALKSLFTLLLLGGVVPVPAQAQAKSQEPLHRPHAKVKHRVPLRRRLDINTATKAQLAKVKGLNEALAGRIIAHRPYLTMEHLVLNGVLPQPLFLSIREYITCVPPKNWESLVHPPRSPKPAGK